MILTIVTIGVIITVFVLGLWAEDDLHWKRDKK